MAGCVKDGMEGEKGRTCIFHGASRCLPLPERTSTSAFLLRGTLFYLHLHSSRQSTEIRHSTQYQLHKAPDSQIQEWCVGNSTLHRLQVAYYDTGVVACDGFFSFHPTAPLQCTYPLYFSLHRDRHASRVLSFGDLDR